MSKTYRGIIQPERIVVIECDDWGGIRMPSISTHNQLLNANIPVNSNIFDRFDTLEDKQDLEFLFEILLNVKDKNGHHAVMTTVTNVANPDFEKIKESDFTKYFYEPFTETLKRYGRNPETLNTWKKGMELDIFIPEYHGREHISVQFWLQKLRDGDAKLRTAFDLGFVSVNVEGIHPAVNGFRPEFYFNNFDQIDFLKNSISHGVNLFRNIFGYTPRTFVPSNGIFHPMFEQKVADTGIKYLYVSHLNKIPDNNGKLRLKYYRTGKKALSGLTYYTRNCAFEPADLDYKGIELTLRQIEASFRWGKPAMISTHRVNFVGGIDKKNREKGLAELKLLLDAIIKNWSDVEFMSSGDALDILNKTN